MQLKITINQKEEENNLGEGTSCNLRFAKMATTLRRNYKEIKNITPKV